MADERTYTVPLRRGFSKTPRYRRTNKAVKLLREFLARHMKVPLEDVRLGQHLNEFLWQKGIKNPPPRVRVTAQRTGEGIVRAELEGRKYTAVEAPKERTEQPQTMKEKIQAAVGGGKASSETEDAVEKAQDALKSPEPAKKDSPKQDPEKKSSQDVTASEPAKESKK